MEDANPTSNQLLQTVPKMRESWLVNGEDVRFNKLINRKRGQGRARGSKVQHSNIES
jgi:hypothetical protein